MNEQYKFRGKAIGEGEFKGNWVFGDLITVCPNGSNKKAFIHPQNNSFQRNGELAKIIIAHEVDPETIGQCIGIPDANKETLYAGDIVRHMRISGSGISTKELYIIAWLPSSACFHMKPVKGEGGCSIWSNSEGYMPYVKVGNIHDNPELLEVGK